MWNSCFQRSRLLLTGIANAPAHDDLTIEKHASRELLAEMRVLRELSNDPEADRLLTAIEPIMLKLANATEASGARDVDIVRAGIREQNLLFRLRIAEAEYAPNTFILTREDQRAP
jgi:hypothetical protein